MEALNDWIWNNLVFVIILSVVGGIVFTYCTGRVIYKLACHKPVSRIDWLAAGICLVVGLLVFLLTGLDNSPISI